MACTRDTGIHSSTNLRIEETILRNMVYNEDYTRKVLPFLKEAYFHDTLERILFEHINSHVEKYNKNPTTETLGISITERTDLSDDQLDSISEILGAIETHSDSAVNEDWLQDETEKLIHD